MQTTYFSYDRVADEIGEGAREELYAFCRFCAKKNEFLVPIFSGQGIIDELPTKIKSYIPLEVSENDELPLNICAQCAQCVMLWHQFILGCVKADEVLRNMHKESLCTKPVDVPVKCDEGMGKIKQTSDDLIQFHDNKEEVMVPATLDLTEMNEAVFSIVPEAKQRSKKLAKPILDEQLHHLSSIKTTEENDNTVDELTMGKTETSDDSSILIYSIYVSNEDEDEYHLCDVKTKKTKKLILHETTEVTVINQVSEDNKNITESYIKLWAPVEKNIPENSIKNYVINQPHYIFKCDKRQLGKLGIRCRPKLVKNKKMLSCPHCKKMFRNEPVLITHLRFHTGVTPFFCRYCGKRFRLSLSLKKHFEVCGKMREGSFSRPLTFANYRYVCTLCTKSYKLRSSLHQHLRNHLGVWIPKLKCDVCGEKFFRKAQLLEHQLQHPKSQRHLCKLCDKHLVSERDLKEHHITHSNERPFVCKHCGSHYKRRSHLIRHSTAECLKRLNNQQNVSHKTFKCEVCSRVFKTRKLLRVHNRSHTGERKFKCPHCDSSFSQSGALTRHVRTVHGGHKDYICDVCKRCFTAKASMLNHQRIHTGEKPFPCQHCPKTFRTKQQHRLHQLVHTDARPYTCSYCNKKFKRRPHLIVHIRTHTGEKPYACSVCGKAFAQRNDMTKHLKVHNRLTRKQCYC